MVFSGSEVYVFHLRHISAQTLKISNILINTTHHVRINSGKILNTLLVYILKTYSRTLHSFIIAGVSSLFENVN